MIRIAIDLELESDGKVTGDIIQLGYSIFCTRTNNIIQSSGDYIKIDRPLHPFIIGLTKITDKDIQEKGVSIYEAYGNMINLFNKLVEEEQIRCETESNEVDSTPAKFKRNKYGFYQIVEWGSGDVSKLKEDLNIKEYEKDVGQELKTHQERIHFKPKSGEDFDVKRVTGMVKNNYRFDFGRSSLNLKAAYQMYQEANIKKFKGGLSTSMKALGLQFESYKEEVAPGKFRQHGQHNAIADALSTAHMYLELRRRQKLYVNPVKVERSRIIYKNYKGDISVRDIEIVRYWFGSTEFHKEPQMLLKAIDLHKKEERDFAVKDISSWEEL
jgi:DNA polymerase III epsilon subunit-like protein